MYRHVSMINMRDDGHIAEFVQRHLLTRNQRKRQCQRATRGLLVWCALPEASLWKACGSSHGEGGLRESLKLPSFFQCHAETSLKILMLSVLEAWTLTSHLEGKIGLSKHSQNARPTAMLFVPVQGWPNASSSCRRYPMHGPVPHPPKARPAKSNCPGCVCSLSFLEELTVPPLALSIYLSTFLMSSDVQAKLRVTCICQQFQWRHRNVRHEKVGYLVFFTTGAVCCGLAAWKRDL